MPTAGPDIGMFHPGSNSHGKCPDPGMHPDGSCPGESGNGGIQTMPYIIDPSKPQDTHITLMNDATKGFNLSEENNSETVQSPKGLFCFNN